MTIEQLRKAHTARPFQPFVIHMADGREVAVPHPELLATSPSGRTLTVYLPDDTADVIDLLLVTDLLIKPLTHSAGKRRKD